MRIQTKYNCTFETKDFRHLANGKDLSATLSDGSVEFAFRMDDEVRQALLGQNGVKQVNGVVVDAPHRNGKRPLMLTDGKRKWPENKNGPRGICPFCQKGRDKPILIVPHIRFKHPDKPIHPGGKVRCPKCIQRFLSAQGLLIHTKQSHKG